MLRRIGLVLIAAGVGIGVGCSPYRPGSFVTPTGHKQGFSGQRATIGCLDIAVARRPDHDGSAVLAYKFGNRCDTPQLVDLAGVTVIGRETGGEERQLRPFDPTLEVRPLPIDARLVGGEVLAYPAPQEIVQVCVDVASLARTTPERWMCFAREAGPVDDPGDAIAPSGRIVTVAREVAR